MRFIILGRSIFKEFIEALNLCEKFVVLDWGNRINVLTNLLEVRGLYPECHLVLTNSMRGDLESVIIGAAFKFGIELYPNKRPFLSHKLKMKKNHLFIRFIKLKNGKV